MRRCIRSSRKLYQCKVAAKTVLLLLAMCSASTAQAYPQWIIYTLPTHTRHEWVDPSMGADSVHVGCEAGPSSTLLQSLSKAYLWRAGGPAPIDSHTVAGRAGYPDSFHVPSPGTFFITTRNEVGMSCASSSIVIQPDVTTGVEVLPSGAYIVQCRLYSILGRLVARIGPHDCYGPMIRERGLPSGVYWMKATWSTGQVTSKKIAVLR